MIEKFKTFYNISHDRINFTLIWVWFSGNIKFHINSKILNNFFIINVYTKAFC